MVIRENSVGGGSGVKVRGRAVFCGGVRIAKIMNQPLGPKMREDKDLEKR